MKKIYIKTTESCQLKCEHCYIGDNRKLKGFFNDHKTIDWLRHYIRTYSVKEQDILFSFHGGEPFLCSLAKMQAVVDAFPRATFDATSNLVFGLTKYKLDFIKSNFVDKYGNGKPFIKTSWDYKIRFQNSYQLATWEDNIKILNHDNIDFRVIICVTSKLVNEVNPELLIEYLLGLGINDIQFERLTANTTSDKTLIPDYKKQDEWLLKFYELSKGKIIVDLFEELKYACKGIFINCRKRCCMKEVLTINADGTIGGCPNSSIKHFFTTINILPINLYKNFKRLQLINKESICRPECYTCDLYNICNGDCHQLTWNGDLCATPKNLIRRIKDDMEKESKIILPNQ